MPTIPRRVGEMLTEGLKQFQPIIAGAKTRDVNEADTVVIATDVLAGVFGYDKYNEITREYAIRGTSCDLAIKLDEQPRILIEVKAVGLDLKEMHVKQAVDYAANKGIEWTVLTNSARWKVYRVTFAKPIDQELILDIDLLSLNPKTQAHIDLLYPLSRDGLMKSALLEYHTQRQAMSKFSLAALLLSEPMLKTIRRELRRFSPGVNIETDDIKTALMEDVLKREVVEGEKAEEARRRLQRLLRKQLRASQPKIDGETQELVEDQEESPEESSETVTSENLVDDEAKE